MDEEERQFLLRIRKSIREKIQNDLKRDVEFHNYKRGSEALKTYSAKLEQDEWAYISKNPASYNRYLEELLSLKGEASAVMSATNQLLHVYESMTGIDMSWYKEAIQKSFDHRAYIETRKIRIGRGISALVFFGSSANQAIKAVSTWLQLSETKVRDSYYYVRDTADNFLVGSEEEKHLFRLSVLFFGIETNSPFPRKHKKALKALILGSCRYLKNDVSKFNKTEERPEAEEVLSKAKKVSFTGWGERGKTLKEMRKKEDFEAAKKRNDKEQKRRLKKVLMALGCENQNDFKTLVKKYVS